MNRFWKAVVLTWLLAGTLDLTGAYVSQWIRTGAFAEKMLYYIAGGILGPERAMQGGNGVALLGLGIHYSIAFVATLVFYILLPRIRWMTFDKFVVGSLYAVIVNLVVSGVINWLTPLPAQPFVLARVVVAWFILALCLGIPIAWKAYRYYGIQPFRFRPDQ